MKTLTKKSLDELAKTMSVISESDLVNFGGGGGTTMKFNNQQELYSYLNDILMIQCVEVSFVIYYNGTCAVYVDDTNTSTSSTITLWGSASTGYYFPSGGAGAVSEWGHTHPSGIHTPSQADYDAKNKYAGLPASIYTFGGAHPY